MPRRPHSRLRRLHHHVHRHVHMGIVRMYALLSVAVIMVFAVLPVAIVSVFAASIPQFESASVTKAQLASDDTDVQTATITIAAAEPERVDRIFVIVNYPYTYPNTARGYFQAYIKDGQWLFQSVGGEFHGEPYVRLITEGPGASQVSVDAEAERVTAIFRWTAKTNYGEIEKNRLFYYFENTYAKFASGWRGTDAYFGVSKTVAVPLSTPPLPPIVEPTLPGTGASSFNNTANVASAIGANLDGRESYITDPIFLNYAANARKFRSDLCTGGWEQGGTLTLDSNGWVKDAPQGTCPALRMMDGVYDEAQGIATNGNYPLGTYILTWKGSGTLALSPGGDATNFTVTGPGRATFQLTKSTHAGVDIVIKNFDRTDYIRDIFVIPPGGVCGASGTELDYFCGCKTERGGTGTPPAGGTCYDFEQVAWNPYNDSIDLMNNPKVVFDPRSLERMKSYSTLRYMDLMKTNGDSATRAGSPIVTWADRTPVKYQTMTTDRGVAYEYLIALANVLGANPWFNMPHKANDEYVRQFATLVKGQLRPDLKAYVEYSNEVFNPQFQQFHWAVAEEKRLNLDSLNGINYMAKRTKEVMKIWTEVFGSSANRLVRVMGGWAATNGWWSGELMEKVGGNQYVDALAINPYFGYHLGTPAASVRSWSLDTLFDEILNGGHVAGEAPALKQVEDAVKANAAVARTHNVELVAYEGGQHLAGVQGVESDRTVTQLFHAANRDSRMGTVYTRLLNIWKDNGGGLFLQFVHMAPWSRWGSWGALEYPGQPDTPKFRSLVNFASSHPCWWDNCRRGDFRSSIQRPAPAPQPVPLPTPTPTPPTPAPSPTPTPTPTPAPAPDGLVAHWTFDGVAGGKVVNQTGDTRFDATIDGDVDCTISGKVGTACMVGNNTESIWVKPYPLPKTTTNFTIAGWFNLGGTVGEKYLMEMGFESVALKYFGKGELHCIVRRGPTTWSLVRGQNFTPTPGEWFHAACVSDGTTMKLFVNGNPVPKETVDISGFTGLYDDAITGLGMNCRLKGYCAKPAPGWPIEKGAIDDVRVYTRALSIQEIQALPGNPGQ